ncbi:MAG TPA: FtsX-like permease family protein [Bryobacteraceae bacterium]|nr:FtsX-like permease family protein [Bryobacteraceae bacterium]
MNTRFEFFIANRYLRARRKKAVISIITLISILGVAAGVMALVIALAVNNGFKNTLQRDLLGAMAHITVLEKEPGNGIDDWRQMAARIRQVPHVTAVAPALYSQVFLSGPLQSKGAILKGVNIDAELAISESLRHLKEGSLDRLRDPNAAPPCILLGSSMVEDTGMLLHSRVNVVSPQGELTPFGPRPSIRPFQVCGIFESGFFEIDDNWVYTSIQAAQQALSLQDVINQIEIKVDDLNQAPVIAKQIEKVIGPRYTTTTWMERNRQLLNALKMERAVTIITIGLIELVAALNILITLVMMVMEKYRDIAVLMSMGARQRQIRRIFMLQGLLIGVVGTAIGLTVGYTLSYLANHYQWIRLDQTVYSLSFVPFEPRWADGFWIAGAAILVSFLATIYPARSATRIAPAEVLRYE